MKMKLRNLLYDIVAVCGVFFIIYDSAFKSGVKFNFPLPLYIGGLFLILFVCTGISLFEKAKIPSAIIVVLVYGVLALFFWRDIASGFMKLCNDLVLIYSYVFEREVYVFDIPQKLMPYGNEILVFFMIIFILEYMRIFKITKWVSYIFYVVIIVFFIILSNYKPLYFWIAMAALLIFIENLMYFNRRIPFSVFIALAVMIFAGNFIFNNLDREMVKNSKSFQTMRTLKEKNEKFLKSIGLEKLFTKEEGVNYSSLGFYSEKHKVGSVDSAQLTDNEVMYAVLSDNSEPIYIIDDVCMDYDNNEWSCVEEPKEYNIASYSSVYSTLLNNKADERAHYEWIKLYKPGKHYAMKIYPENPCTMYLNYYATNRDDEKDLKMFYYSVKSDFYAELEPYSCKMSEDLKEYEKYVYENYLTVNAKNKDYLTELVGGYREHRSVEDTLKVAEELKKYFNDEFTYDLSPGKIPKGREVVDYFFETKKGYCEYFATASVMAMRSAGIPARYVGGFIFSLDASDPYYEEDNKVIREKSIKEKYAHAWTQIYIDGIGWINYDFTAADYLGINNPVQEETTLSQETTSAKETASTSENETTSSVITESMSAVESTSHSTSDASVTVGNDGNGIEVKHHLRYNVIVVVFVSVILLTIFFFCFKGLRSSLDRRNQLSESLKICNDSSHYATNVQILVLNMVKVYDRYISRQNKNESDFAFLNRIQEKQGSCINLLNLIRIGEQAVYSNRPLTREEYEQVLRGYNDFYILMSVQSMGLKKFLISKNKLI